MVFAVSNDCRNLGLRAGAIIFRGVHVGPSSTALRAEISKAVQEVRARFARSEDARATPEISAYQEILRKVGVNPRREQNSVDRLVAFALKRGDLPAINNLVDAYNLVSLRTLCSLGAHDLGRLSLPVQLRLFTGSETFTPLGRTAPEAVTAGEFGYVDGEDRILCRLDVLQAEFSKVTDEAKDVLLIVEGTTVHSADVLYGVCTDVSAQVTCHCGGMAEVVAVP